MGILPKPVCHDTAMLNAFAQKVTAKVCMPGAQAGGKGIRQVVPLNSFSGLRHALPATFARCLKPAHEEAENPDCFGLHDDNDDFRMK